MTPPLYIDMISSPLGVLLLAHCSGYLCGLDFQDHQLRFRQMLARRFGNVALEQRDLPLAIREPLEAYLGGTDMDAVQQIPLHASGTRFQQQVWKALRAIPAGTLWSSAQIARAIGQPGAAADVELAAARNPVALIVPCHRLIGSAGRLSGYVGGLARKYWLLAHEGILGEEPDTSPPAPASLRQQLAWSPVA